MAAYTKEQLDYIREIASIKNIDNATVTKKFNSRFKLNKTERAIYSLRNKKGICLNNDKSKCKIGCKGNTTRSLPIGSENIVKGGYTIVKVAHPSKWEFKQRVIWEKYHGRKIKKGERLLFLDGNNQNFNIDNLELLKVNEIVSVLNLNYQTDNKDLTKAGINVIKIQNKIKELKGED